MSMVLLLRAQARADRPPALAGVVLIGLGFLSILLASGQPVPNP